MVNCPKCGAAVREEKAFCHNCGSPMDAAMRQRDEPQPDFGATIVERPRRAAPPQPFVPPAITEVQPAGSETAPVAQQQQQQQPATARVALPLPPDAQPTGKRKRRIGFGFVIFLLFLMFLVFVLALVID